MNRPDWLAGQFESYRAHLGAVAYRMLGSPSETDDAVQGAGHRHGAGYGPVPAAGSGRRVLRGLA